MNVSGLWLTEDSEESGRGHGAVDLHCVQFAVISSQCPDCQRSTWSVQAPALFKAHSVSAVKVPQCNCRTS